MFDIDLMNSTGLQKIISKGGIDKRGAKQKITFEQDNIEEDIIEDVKKETKPLKPASFISILMASLILGGFLVFGLINVGDKIDFSPITKYFQSVDNLSVAKSTAIKFLSNPEKIKTLTNIDVDENLVINFKIKDISDITLNSEDSRFFKVYDDSDEYQASFLFPLEKVRFDDKDIIIKNLVMQYKNTDEVILTVEGRSIYFIASGKIIYDIMDRLLSTGHIEIWPAKHSDYFTLKYSY